jgi:hypothetical protein
MLAFGCKTDAEICIRFSGNLALALPSQLQRRAEQNSAKAGGRHWAVAARIPDFQRLAGWVIGDVVVSWKS